ncbi:hypothetical protein C2I18_27915 [Paenibacillus sp. PK3_47]|uniref:DUF4190 domain-containing protein n=1 Tax=Paenibacillus sp. PK3_47 TaxID=2072642 RepID=UPI00201DAE10|nr:DUF4190 domain-containing protein [Paenibacillus sp. PK3_47]UQZ37025.1 hypothetical protein C2I18_27915 [Paenibacillus sp. PK3_47]
MSYPPLEPNYNQNYHYQYPPPPPPGRTNGKSVASLVLGILSIVTPYIGLLFGIIAIILSAFSLREIRNRYEQGKGLAIAGLVCGIIGTVIYAVILLLLMLTIVFFNNIDTNFNTFNSWNNI